MYVYIYYAVNELQEPTNTTFLGHQVVRLNAQKAAGDCGGHHGALRINRVQFTSFGSFLK